MTVTADRTSLTVGTQVRLGHGSRADRSRWWTVRAADDRFAILTRQREFAAKGKLVYTIIDWDRGQRGPCDLVLSPWDLAKDDAPADMLKALQRYAAGDHSSGYATQVSHRNNVPAQVVQARP